MTYTLTGQRDRVTDARGVTRYTYDERERLVNRIDPDGRPISYTYDATGNRTSVTVLSGTTSYTFDSWNRIKTVTDPDGGLTEYFYNPVGSLARTVFANGVTETRDYDLLNRLLNLNQTDPSGNVLVNYHYTLDKTGNRVSVRELNRRVDYDYDSLYRLTKEQITDSTNGNRTIDYVYDPVGNRLSRNDSSEGETSYIYDANDRLLTETLNGQVTIYSYDNNGNTVSKEKGATDKVSYDWDYDNRLILAQSIDDSGTQNLEYRYDVDGIRVSKTVDGVETRYLIDTVQAYAQVLEEYTPDGNVQVSYVYGNDLISQKQAGLVSTFLVDGLGSTRSLTDAVGTVVSSYVYDAFGRILNGAGLSQTDYLFAGEQRDSDLGLDYLRARYLQPSIGRFVSRDVFPGDALQPITLHKYLYANANPVNVIDPSGFVGISNVSTSLKILNILQNIVNAIPGSGLAAIGLAIIYAEFIATIYFTDSQTFSTDFSNATEKEKNKLPNKKVSDDPEKMAEMRLQVQYKQSDTHTIKPNPLRAAPETGVSVAQVRNAATLIWITRQDMGWFSSSYYPALQRGLTFTVKRAEAVPPSGVVKGGEQVASFQWNKGDTKGVNRVKRGDYRVDLENLRGHNLKF